MKTEFKVGDKVIAIKKENGKQPTGEGEIVYITKHIYFICFKKWTKGHGGDNSKYGKDYPTSHWNFSKGKNTALRLSKIENWREILK